MPRTARKTNVVIRAIRGLISTVFVVIGIGWLISVLGVIGFAAYDGAKPADAIVVLGAAQYDGRPSPVLRARLDHAIGLWKDSTAPLLIFTGGMGSGDTTSEAAVSAQYARRRGIPENVILLESEGRTTSASMHAVASMLQAREQTGNAPGSALANAPEGTLDDTPESASDRMKKPSIVLVSDPFHMFRLWMLSKRMGIEVHTSPTRTSPISIGSIKNATYILAESLKAPIAFIIG